MLAITSGFHPTSISMPIPPKLGRIGSSCGGENEQPTQASDCETGGSGLTITTAVCATGSSGSIFSADFLAPSFTQLTPARRQLLQGKPSQLFFERWHLVQAAPGALRVCPEPTS
mmetsp:Transcript_54766/g.128046  ORF Transcript_54766/g.128046 Transcript_54766/m.128046 type:complete len:115 (-) Transcript_54766:110-454(-)